MASLIYNRLKQEVGEGFDWATADVRLLLLDAAGSYVADPDDEFVADLTPGSNELATTNYARAALANQVVTRDDVNDRAAWTADDVVFAGLGPSSGGPTIGGAVLYVHVTDDSDSWLVAFLEDVAGTVNGLDATVAFDPTGIIRPT